MQFTLGEAARQCGIAKGTISKAIKTGKLSATAKRTAAGRSTTPSSPGISTPNGYRFRAETVSGEQPETPPKTDPATDALVAELRAVIADLRSDRDH